MKALLITYYFPPSKAIASKRWHQFYSLFNKDDKMNLHILTANWEGEKIDDENVTYIGSPLKYNPPKSLQKSTFIRKLNHPSLFVRSIDRSVFSSWVKGCKSWIDNNENNYNLILSSFGPIACVIIGNYAKKKYKVPFILDLRDLISIQGQKLKLPLLHFLDKQIDRYWTQHVDEFITVSPLCKQKAEIFYKKKATLIFNGFPNKSAFNKTNLTLRKKEINIIYMGTLGINRNPSRILGILDEYIQLNPGIKIKINFASQDNPFDLLSSKLNFIIVNWLGYLNQKDLNDEIQKSDVFLLLEDLTPKGNENLTGKIYEYIQLEKPILASCNPESNIGYVLKVTNTGSIVSSQTEFEKFLNEERFINESECRKFSRQEQYEKLKTILNKY